MSAAKKVALVVDAPVHWTLRPENKKKVQAMLKKRAATRKRNKRAALPPTRTTPHDDAIPQDTFAYALGYLECWVEAYAKSAGVPSEALAAKLGAVLSGENGGK